jgi:transcriptional regulator NrdR family protein
MQIRIVKADGAIEPYLHTKVLGTFHNALSHVGTGDLEAAEQMAEAVTFYLYRQIRRGTLNTDQIHQMVVDVLTSTGHADAAEALGDYRLSRRLQRRRIDVVGEVTDTPGWAVTTQWNKSRIVSELMASHNMDRLMARAIASAVEEKLLKMGVLRVRKSLIHQLVVADMESLLDADRQLAIVG